MSIGLIGKKIADANLGVEVTRMGRISFDFAPQAVDIDLEHMTLPKVLRAPDMIQQEILRHDATYVLCKIGQDAIFSRGDRHLPALQRYQMLRIINFQVSDDYVCTHAMCVLLSAKLCPPQYCAYTCQQFVDTKRLGKIVIGTEIKAAHFILILSTSRNNDDQDSGKLTHALADGETIHLRHHDVEQHKIGHL